MTDDEIIAVVQAHKEGKDIQWREACAPNLSWIDLKESTTAGWFGWDFRNIVYRVKPEPRKPREWWIKCHSNPGNPCPSCGFYDSKDAASKPSRDGQRVASVVHVREVIEDGVS